MKIWVIQEGEPITFIDGGSRPFRTEMLVNRLIEHGHEVVCWVPTFDHLRKSFRFHSENDIELGSHLRYHFLHSPTAYRKTLSFANARHNYEIAEAFRLRSSEEPVPDLILCSVPPLRLAAFVADYAHRRNIPLVIDVRETWPDSLVKNLRGLKRALAQYLFRNDYRRARQILHRADAITAISQDGLKWALRQADHARRDWDNVFPLAYEEAPQQLFKDATEEQEFRASLGILPHQKVLTCIGRVGSSFDFPLVVKLAKKFQKEKRDDVHFVLAGEGPIKSSLQKLYRSLPNLTITGWLNQQQLQRLLHITDIGLLPYKDIHTPAIRNKPLDFISMGIPIVSSLRGELAYLMKQHDIGRLFKSGDFASFEKAVNFILNNPARAEKMREHTLELFHKNFSAKEIYQAFAQQLEELVQSQKRHRHS